METIINRNTSFRSHQPIIKDHRKFVWQSLRNNPDGLTAQEHGNVIWDDMFGKELDIAMVKSARLRRTERS